MSSPRSYPRAERVRAAIREFLAGEVERLRDPGLGFVTITDVTVTRDLRNATVYYTVFGEPVEVAATKDALERATPHLRTALAHAVRMRYVPKLRFEEDPVPAQASRVDSIIAELHRTEEHDDEEHDG